MTDNLAEELAAARREKDLWKERAEAVAEELDGVAAQVRRTVPGWIRWAAFGAILLFAAIGIVGGWHWTSGAEAEQAQAAETLWDRLWHVGVALAVAVAATAGSLFVLTVVLDPLTVRREFLALAEQGEADALSLAIFSVSTSIFAGLIFFGVLDALSVG